jgi:hypothetical protein
VPLSLGLSAARARSLAASQPIQLATPPASQLPQRSIKTTDSDNLDNLLHPYLSIRTTTRRVVGPSFLSDARWSPGELYDSSTLMVLSGMPLVRCSDPNFLLCLPIDWPSLMGPPVGPDRPDQ